MPKRKQAMIEQETAPPAPVELSKRVSNLIEAIRQPFTDYANAFHALTVSRGELAAKFMKAYTAWALEVSGGSFVAFVRLLDATVPEDRDGYRAHSAYQAADYLRRLVAQATKPAVEADTAAPRPVQPIEVVARLVATLSPFVDDMDLIWSAFARELHWSERQVAHIQRLVGQAGPLLTKRGREHKLHRVA